MRSVQPLGQVMSGTEKVTSVVGVLDRLQPSGSMPSGEQAEGKPRAGNREEAEGQFIGVAAAPRIAKKMAGQFRGDRRLGKGRKSSGSAAVYRRQLLGTRLWHDHTARGDRCGPRVRPRHDAAPDGHSRPERLPTEAETGRAGFPTWEK